MKNLGDEIHVWRASVSAYAPLEAELREALAPQERARSERFHFAQDRIQYIVAHGLLRRLLAEYLQVAPSQLEFAEGPQGKPYLTAPEHGRALHFNLSHSRDLVLVAVALTELGVDVEYHTSGLEFDELAGQFFSPAERRVLARLPAEAKLEGFYACWTRKEAYIKATGLGVSQGLDYFDVTLAPGTAVKLVADRRAPGSERSWSVINLETVPGYSAALVVRTGLPTPRCFVLDPIGELAMPEAMT